MRATFGASLTVQATTIDDNGGSATRRITHGIADTLTIPDAYRGTTQLLRLQAAGASGNTGRVSVDPSSTALYDVEFEEAPGDPTPDRILTQHALTGSGWPPPYR
ncbi:hypothetical protein [Streptomyces microflavus]|uniref:hypothetical protein n=1 Tax=Streptomyces microflavus TaxID=1919 RepID=UPI003B217388